MLEIFVFKEFFAIYFKTLPFNIYFFSICSAKYKTYHIWMYPYLSVESDIQNICVSKKGNVIIYEKKELFITVQINYLQRNMKFSTSSNYIYRVSQKVLPNFRI